jgi:hypothetical protein
MSKSFEQLIEESKRLKLQPDARVRIRGILRAHMQAYPIVPKISEVRTVGFWGRLATVPFSIRVVPAVCVIVLVVGGGVSYAAEGALPGQVLYKVKVYINEPVMGRLAVTQRSRIDHEQRLAERRLEEAEGLAIQGKLNSTINQEIEIAFEQHANNVAKELAAMRDASDSSAALDESSQFESTLSAHKHILSEASTKNGATEAQVLPSLVAKIDANAKITAQVRVEAESRLRAKSDKEAAASAKTAQTEAIQVLEEVRIYISGNPKLLDKEAEDTLTMHMKAADTLVADGKKAMSKELYKEALLSFQKAERIGEEAKLFLRARKALKVQILLPSVWGDIGVTSSSTATSTQPIISPSPTATSSPSKSPAVKSKINL